MSADVRLGVATDPTAAPRPVASGRGIRQRVLTGAGRHLVLITVSLLFFLPFYWMVVSALKSTSQILSPDLQWIPDPVVWTNLPEALNQPGFAFLPMLANSVFYAGAVTLGTVLSSALVGYGFARMRFWGRNLLFAVTMATLMIPSLIIFIPTYVLFKTVGLIGTWAPLIAPQFLGSAFFIFLMRQFFLTIPTTLTDAARVDGAGELRIFAQIMLPLVKPALAVVAVFSWLGTWNDFFGPLVYLSDPALHPLSLGLFAFQSQRSTEWGLLMAASVLVTLPLIILFAFTQRYFLRGITLSGIQG